MLHKINMTKKKYLFIIISFLFIGIIVWFFILRTPEVKYSETKAGDNKPHSIYVPPHVQPDLPH